MARLRRHDHYSFPPKVGTMTEETNAITIDAPATPSPVSTTADTIADHWRWANAYASSSMVPQHFQGKPQDCFVIVQLADELGISAATALQNVSLIGGKPVYSTKFAIALANRAKVFAGPIRWKVNKGEKPEDLSVTAYAPLNDGDLAEVTVSMQIARAEGWTRNKKYQTIPEQMLRWRSAKWLIDLHCPEILLGFDVGGEFDSASERHTSVIDNHRENRQGQNLSLQQAIEQQKNKAIEAVTITEEEQPQSNKPGAQDSPGEISEED